MAVPVRFSVLHVSLLHHQVIRMNPLSSLLHLFSRLLCRLLRQRDWQFALLVSLACLGLAVMPSGFDSGIYKDSVRAKALVLRTDDTRVHQFGIVRQGNQDLRIRIENTRYAGQELDANNTVIGKLELDKIFRPGDHALVVLDTQPATGQIVFANVIDHYRLDAEAWLFGAFVVLLVALTGGTGVKAIISFIFTGLCLWKLMIPAMLKGANPILLSLGVVTLLVFVTCLLVGGLTRKGIAAFLGSLGGVVFTCVIALVFADSFHLNGAVRPFSESLLYSGHANLRLTDIFLAGIFLASSGALMDVAMDIAASLEELHRHNPTLGFSALSVAGLRIGRAVIGTMTTTLLLAYSGGYTTLLMVFTAQGIPVENLLNLSYVSTELFHTVVGSFGLILVAPCTAFCGALIFSRQTRNQATPHGTEVSPLSDTGDVALQSNPL